MSRGKKIVKKVSRIDWDLTGIAQKAPTVADYPDIKRALAKLDILKDRPEQVGMISLVGSHGYGLATSTSDLDFRGFYVAPSEDLWGLAVIPQQLEAKEPDLTLFEVGKFCQLALSSNPNVIEILWANTIWDTVDAQELKAAKSLFLSQKIRDSYGGYANRQFEIALKGGRDHLYLRRRKKAIRHLFRLYEQGLEILETGHLTYRLADPERIRAFSELDDTKLEQQYLLFDKRFKAAKTDLPEEPDREKINELLIGIRRRHFNL